MGIYIGIGYVCPERKALGKGDKLAWQLRYGDNETKVNEQRQTSFDFRTPAGLHVRFPYKD